MTIEAVSIDAAGRAASSESSRAWTLTLWVARLAVTAILGLGAFVKFFNYVPEGSMDLAVALEVGRGTVTLIGLVELTAAILILVPRARAVGALLAIFTMLGALFSHAVKIGWSGNAAAEMWPLAPVVLAAALFVLGASLRSRR
jgi:uncharacterized membrane protein YphA (DoxX/SURF4 family)